MLTRPLCAAGLAVLAVVCVSIGTPSIAAPSVLSIEQPAPKPSTPPAAQPPARGTASVTGRVTSAADNLPVGRARITLRSTRLETNRVAITDGQGRFEITDLPAGTYQIAASKTGFVSQMFGARGGAAGAGVEIADAQRVEQIDFALAPAGSVAGRILDEDGGPFAGATIEALAAKIVNGERTLIAVAIAESDDRGQFRLHGLAAGQYYISAFDPSFENAGDLTGRLTYSPTFHPGVIVIDEARRVEVRPGAEAERVEFRLKIVRPARIGGILRAHDGRQLRSAAVRIGRAVDRAVIPAATDVTISPDGRFTFFNVPPGKYTVRARGETERNSGALFGSFSLTVEGRDVRNIEITLTPGAVVTGELYLEARGRARPQVDLSGVRVRIPTLEGSTLADTRGSVSPDGTFQLRGVMPGAHLVRVEGLAPPWRLKAVQYRGRDITDVPLDIESGQSLHDIRIVLTDVSAEISGTVRNEQGEAVRDCLVFAFPSDPALWQPHSRHVRVARPGGDGRYRIAGLPAAEYLLAASRYTAEADADQRDALERLSAVATRLTLAEGEVRVQDLRLREPMASARR